MVPAKFTPNDQRDRGLDRFKRSSLNDSVNSRYPKVKVRNLQRSVRIHAADLARFANKAVRICFQLPRLGLTDLQNTREVSVLIVSDRRMESLHRQFLNETGPTDVLTFQHGEIFISAETARRNARSFGNSLKRELCLYVVHGLLHLHGFDDRNAAGKRTMARVQTRVLAQASGLN